LKIRFTGLCGNGKPKLIGKLPNELSLFVNCGFLESPVPVAACNQRCQLAIHRGQLTLFENDRRTKMGR
jgi:hypothetical protein